MVKQFQVLPSPKGMRLASGAKDGSVAIWALENDGQGSGWCRIN